MIEIEYKILGKEDMYVSCVDPSLDPERSGCWLLPPPTVPTEHRSGEAAQEILKRRHIKAAARPATTTTHFKPIPSSQISADGGRWGPEY